MTVAFASLDGALDLYISFYITKGGGEELLVSSAVTTPMTFLSKVELFGTLYRFRLGKCHQAEELKDLLARLRYVNTERNFLSHGSWTYSSVAGKTVLIKLKMGREARYEELDPADIETLVTEMKGIQCHLQTFALDGSIAMCNGSQEE